MPADKTTASERDPAPRPSSRSAPSSKPAAREPTPSNRRARGTSAARQIGRELATKIGPHKYDMWFGHTKLKVSGRRLEVQVSSSYVAKWIDSHFADELRGVARAALGAEADIDVRVAPEMFPSDGTAADGPRSGAASAGARGDSDAARADAWPVRPVSPDGRSSGAERHRRQRGSDGAGRPPASPRPRRRGPVLRRLDAFVVGASNQLAYSTACELVEAPDAPAVSPLFVHGDCGLGKTHLLQGICGQYAARTGRPDQVRYMTGEQFTNDFIASLRHDAVETFRRRIRRLDLLAIDDVHFLSNKVRTQGEFLHSLDALALTGARIVLASDEHPRAIKRFSQALVSRFLSGMVVGVERPDRATRIAIVQRLADARRLPMNETAVEALAARCVGSVRELEGAIMKLAAVWAITRSAGDASGAANGRTTGAPSAEDGAGSIPERGIGLVLVEQLFQNHAWKPPVPVRMATIIDIVCRRTGIGRADLMGSSRHRRVVLGRALIAYMGRDMTTLSYPEIARALGRTFHSTVHTAEQRLRRQLVEDPLVETGDACTSIHLRELVDQLRHEITRATTG